MGQHVDMRGSTDETIHVLRWTDVEMDIYTVHDLITKNWICHLSLYFTTVVVAFVILQAGWMPTYITVFTAAYQDYLFEVAEMTILT